MTRAEKIDAALREIRSRKETRGQDEKERNPGWYQRWRPSGGDWHERSVDWSGGSFGGRSWSGGREK